MEPHNSMVKITYKLLIINYLNTKFTCYWWTMGS